MAITESEWEELRECNIALYRSFGMEISRLHQEIERLRAVAAGANTGAVTEVLEARQKRAEQLHDMVQDAREMVRKRLEPGSPQEDRALYEKLNAALYTLRGDPFDMHIQAALAAGAAVRADETSKEKSADASGT